MALLFMDGFGGGDSAFKWDPISDTWNLQSATPRVPGGFYAGNVNAGSRSLYKTIPAASKVIIGVGLRAVSGGGNPILEIQFYGDGGVTQHITVRRNSGSGLLQILRGATLLATGTQQLSYDQWNYVEVSVTISDTVGEVHVRLNGGLTDEVSFVGDTKNAGTATTIDTVRLASSYAVSSHLADVYICNDTGTTNNAFLGDVTVRTLSPTGNGTYSQLVGSDGNSTDNYLLVDEHPYSGTDYVGSATVGQKDTYTMADLPGGVTTVHAVQVSGSMAKSDATLGSARFVLRSGGTDYTGTTRNLTTTFSGYYDLYETNPATGTAWTPSAINGAESGMEVV